MKTKAISAGGQMGRSFTNHVSHHIQSHVATIYEQQQRHEENKILNLMRNNTFEGFIEEYRKMWDDFPGTFDEHINLPEIMNGLKRRWEIENSPLAKALREE